MSIVNALLALCLIVFCGTSFSETVSCDFAPISIDNRIDSSGCRVVEGDDIRINSSKKWFENCQTASVLDGAYVLSDSGSPFIWTASTCGTHVLQYQAKDRSGGIIGSYAARFEFRHKPYESQAERIATCLFYQKTARKHTK